jgi:hypothetical protein
MYAKLDFPANTEAAKRNRDIVRLITDSYNGDANLANLEFIVTGGSELYAGENSGWTFANANNTSVNTGSITATSDSVYYLKSECANTSKIKYCWIGIHNSNNNSTSANSNTVNIFMGPVMDYGNSTMELVIGGNNTTVHGDYDGVGYCNNQNAEIHIWATSRMLVMAGYQRASLGFPALMAILECPETAQHIHRGKIPWTWVRLCPSFSWDQSPSSFYERGTGQWNDYRYNPKALMHFPDALYDEYTGRSLRNWGIANRSAGNDMLDYGWAENGTKGGSGIGSLLNSTTCDPENYVKHWGPHAFYWHKDGATKNSAGEDVVELYPYTMSVKRIGVTTMDFTTLTGFYKCFAGFGSWGDTLTVGADSYVYLPLDPNYGAIAIKKQ